MYEIMKLAAAKLDKHACQSSELLTVLYASAVYVFVSHRLFLLTNDLKSVVIPSAKVSKLLWRNFAMLGFCSVVLYAAGFVVLRLLGLNRRILEGL